MWMVVGLIACGDPGVTMADLGWSNGSAGGGKEDDGEDGIRDGERPDTIAILGGGSNTADHLDVVVMATAADGLNLTRDLTFNPDVPGQMWVVNTRSESATVFHDVGTPNQRAKDYWSPGSAHFHVRPSAIAWRADGIFATIHETDLQTQGSDGTPGDFMGPTLQGADLDIFDAGHGSHLDMLHNSPNGMGIAWDTGNRYRVFDGAHGSLTRYDFRVDHGPAGADHSDGVVLRFAQGEVSRVEMVPSHMEVDHASGLLYVADTGNSRIAVLGTSVGEVGDPLHPNYDGTQQFHVTGADLRTLLDGLEFGIEYPSGLALKDGVLYVGDVVTARIFAFTLDGELIDWLQVPDVTPGAMTGIDFDPTGALYVIDSAAGRPTCSRPPRRSRVLMWRWPHDHRSGTPRGSRTLIVQHLRVGVLGRLLRARGERRDR